MISTQTCVLLSFVVGVEMSDMGRGWAMHIFFSKIKESREQLCLGLSSPSIK